MVDLPLAVGADAPGLHGRLRCDLDVQSALIEPADRRRGVTSLGPSGLSGDDCGTFFFWVQRCQVDAVVAAAQLGVGGQRPLPGGLGGLVPGCTRLGGLFECLPAGSGLLCAGGDREGLLPGQ